MPKPPPLLVLAYRFLGWRLGPSYRDWVHDDLARPGWLVRQGAPVMAVLLGLGGAITQAVGGSANRLLALIVVLGGAGLFLRNQLRERAFRQQGLDPAGNPAASWYDDDRGRLHRNVASAVSTVVLVIAGLTMLALRSR